MQVIKYVAISAVVGIGIGAAQAHDGVSSYRPESHAPAGVMVDHLHKQGEWMLGLRVMQAQQGDTLRAGSEQISTTELAQMGYSQYAKSMDMHMIMLDMMYAVTDNVTLMLMPQYVQMDMSMGMTPVIETDDTTSTHHGGVHDHSVEGMGDTHLGALFRLGQWGSQQLHGAMLLNVPTGDIEQKDQEGRFVAYGMQLGTGTWDLMPSLTYTGYRDLLSWGAQLQTVQQLENKNDSGFAFGERYFATGWGAYRVLPWISTSVRLGYEKSLDIKGHYNGPHNHSMPAHRQKNYGGEFWTAGWGVNLMATSGALEGTRLGLEWLTPISESDNGVQTERADELHMSLSRAF